MTSLTSNPAFDPSHSGSGDVGVARLASPVAIAPVTLPPAGDLFSLARSQAYTVVAYGTESGGDVLTTKRRFAAARSLGFTSELLALTFKTGGPNAACSSEGGLSVPGHT